MRGVSCRRAIIQIYKFCHTIHSHTMCARRPAGQVSNTKVKNSRNTNKSCIFSSISLSLSLSPSLCINPLLYKYIHNSATLYTFIQCVKARFRTVQSIGSILYIPKILGRRRTCTPNYFYVIHNTNSVKQCLHSTHVIKI